MNRNISNSDARTKWMSENFVTEEFEMEKRLSEADFIMQVDSSFYPIFREGQHIYVKECDTLNDGDFGAVVLNGKEYLKFYRTEDVVSPDGWPSQRVVLQSVIPSVPTVTVGPDDEFIILGRVIA